MSDVVQFPKRTYEAKLFRAILSGFDVWIAGTLDGFVDLSIQSAEGSGLTYSLTPNDAKVLASHLVGCAEDIRLNCRHDADPLLIK